MLGRDHPMVRARDFRLYLRFGGTIHTRDNSNVSYATCDVSTSHEKFAI